MHKHANCISQIGFQTCGEGNQVTLAQAKGQKAIHTRKGLEGGERGAEDRHTHHGGVPPCLDIMHLLCQGLDFDTLEGLGGTWAPNVSCLLEF